MSFMYAIVALAGMADLVRKRKLPKLTKYDRIIVYPALAFFIVNALSVIRPDFKIADLAFLNHSLMFLLPYFVIRRYRYVSDANEFDVFVKAVPYGAILLLPWLLYQGVYLNQRLEGGAGNPIPFAMICTLMLPICIINLTSEALLKRLLSLFGFAVFAAALVFSQTRSMYIAVIPNILVAVYYLYCHSKHRLKEVVIAALICASLATLIIDKSAVLLRFNLLTNSISSIFTGDPIDGESVQMRVTLLRKGFCLAKERPLVGYGIANRREVLSAEQQPSSGWGGICDTIHSRFFFTHFHNGFVSAYIDAGVFGLLSTLALLFSPLALSIVSPNDGTKRLRISVALCLTSVYVMAGMTNLLFGHDLIDVIFLIFSTFLALSIKPSSDALSREDL